MNSKINNVMFEKISEFENQDIDTRFMKAKIWIMHLGRNYNNSLFTQEVVENAIPSLANTPILAYIEPNEDGELDVSDHREVIEQDNNGNYKLSYKGQAIGVIPETNNAHFEDRLCDDGIVRNYLVVDGLIWTKWDVVNDIFAKQNVKWQSMELDPDSIKYHFDNGVCIFDEFKFDGCCCINCQPAMESSTIEVNFSAEDTKSIAQEIEDKLNQFNKYFSKKEDENLEDNKEINNETIEEPVLENSKEEEEKTEEVEATESNEDVATENACGKKKTKMEKDDSEEVESEDKPKEDEEVVEDLSKKEKKYSLNFSLAYEDIKTQLYDKLYDMEQIENTCYGIVKTHDDYFIYCDFCSGQFYKQSYSQDSDTITFIGERVELFEIFVDEAVKNQMENVSYAKLQTELDKANDSIENYAKENKELKEFKFSVDEASRKANIDEVISKFSTIDKLDLENYRQKAYKGEFKSNEELENILYSVVGKLNFSKLTGNEEKVKENPVVSYSVPLSKEEDNFPYKGLEMYFQK